VAKNRFNLGIGVGVFMLIALAGITGYRIANGRSAGEIIELTERYNQLSRDYTERQRELESNLAECIGYVESARAITERTSANASRAVENLREAISYIEQSIKERKVLQDQLHNLRAGLYRIRDMGGLESE
jgi:hypothetical protein